jgi:hypothetical protein
MSIIKTIIHWLYPPSKWQYEFEQENKRIKAIQEETRQILNSLRKEARNAARTEEPHGNDTPDRQGTETLGLMSNGPLPDSKIKQRNGRARLWL